MELRYNTRKVDDRYDEVSEIGYMENYEHEVTDEPFTMNDFQNWRWDKNIGQWVEGSINEETGEWSLISS